MPSVCTSTVCHKRRHHLSTHCHEGYSAADNSDNPLLLGNKMLKDTSYTSKKENKIFLMYKEIQKRSVAKSYITDHRVHTEWQWPLSGLHSIMMEKLAQSVKGEGCTPLPTPFPYICHHVQSCSVRSSKVGRYIHPISSLSIYVLSSV